MTHIFISYRRSDTAEVAGRLYDTFTNQFGEQRIFKDTESIPSGIDFREELERRIASSSVMLVLIGTRWWQELYDRRQTQDWVRYEIVEGLRHPTLRLIPVLVNNAALPSADRLPKSLRELTYRNAYTIRPEPKFRNDVQPLVKELAGLLGWPLSSPDEPDDSKPESIVIQDNSGIVIQDNRRFGEDPKVTSLRQENERIEKKITNLQKKLQEAEAIHQADLEANRWINEERSGLIGWISSLASGKQDDIETPEEILQLQRAIQQGQQKIQENLKKIEQLQAQGD